MTTAIPEYLISRDGCERAEFGICYGACSEPVKRDASTGRWFITMGHPGFNSPANNADGYATAARADSAMRRYGKRGAR